MDRWTYVKVTPSNQTLILANEGPAGTPATSASRIALPSGSSTSSTGDSVLKRVTILTSHPDSTLVYLQADYAASRESFADISPDSIVATIPATAPPTSAPPVNSSSAVGAAAFGAPAAAVLSLSGRYGSGGGTGRSTRAVDLYASTQNILRDSRSTILDVHA